MSLLLLLLLYWLKKQFTYFFARCSLHSFFKAVVYFLVETCEAIYPPLKGTLSTKLAIYGTQLKISCDEGFAFPGGNVSSECVCGLGGIWSPASAVQDCQRK